MVLVDRERELSELRRLAASPPSFAIVRGRRRIGKSFLVREALSGPRVVAFQADEQPEPEQLAGLARELARLLPGTPRLTFAGWDDAFGLVGAQAMEAPLALVLDEFQYLCASQRALPSIVQRHWDRWDADRLPVLLVLVGSALSFMEGLLDVGSPLYGRAEFRPLLEPFDFRVAAGFAPPRTSGEHLIERFAVLGGTPQYQVWAGARRLRETISDLMLTPGAPLYDEPLQLLRAEDEIRETGRYFGALAAIAGGRTRTGEIAGAIGWDSSNTSKVLDRLQRLGYVALVEPVGTDAPRRRAFWQIRDPYLSFWFRRVFPNRSRLLMGRLDEVWTEIRTDMDAYVGRVFEECVRDWFATYSTLREARNAVRVGRWWSRDGKQEIDLVALDKRGRYSFLASCKWQRGHVGHSVLNDLQRRRGILGGLAAEAKLGIFARRGFSVSLEDRAAREGALLVTAEDLFGDQPNQKARNASA